MTARLSFLSIVPIAAALVAASASAAEAPPANPVMAAAEMMIAAGRLGVMLDHVDMAMKLRAGGDPREEPVETPAQQQLYVVHELRAAVLRYNVMQFNVCRGGTLTGELCARPYLPEWLNEGPDVVPATPVLATRVDDAVKHIMPFWQAMCAKAVAQTGDQTFCAIE